MTKIDLIPGYEWAALDNWLEAERPSSFMAVELADVFAIETPEASAMIQAYRRAQERGETRFVIEREGPRSRAEWYVEAA